jgi:hypothetical protein
LHAVSKFYFYLVPYFSHCGFEGTHFAKVMFMVSM